MKKTLFLLSLVLGVSGSLFAESLPQATKWYGVKKSVYPDYMGHEPSFSSETYFMEAPILQV